MVLGHQVVGSEVYRIIRENGVVRSEYLAHVNDVNLCALKWYIPNPKSLSK